ncbi:MAG: hypothetical protein LBQ28_00005 [Prevotellaceae bacterium]|jgi:hypothetical protein|nr:hypothetical protein [Prevotellaceae bacterium]
MKKIQPPILKELLIEILSQHSQFTCNESIMPFLARFGEIEYYIYVKNVSSAYFPNSPDITRVQLPNREVFNQVSESDISFILLGYDANNDVIICWNPKGLKERLNECESVSLYSRQSYQNEVRSDEFKYAYLRNGDKIIMFKRKNITTFLLNIDTLFEKDEDSVPIPIEENSEKRVPYSPIKFVVNGKLTQITDTQLIEQIKPYLLGYHLFEAVSLVMTHYTEQFPNMTFKDWSLIVRKLKTELLTSK